MVSAALLMAGLRGLQSAGFGRYQPSVWPQPAGFRIDREGFRVGGTSGETFRFPRGIERPQLVSAGPTGATVFMPAGRGGPSVLEVNQAAPGFTLRYPKGLHIGFQCEDSPRLTTAEVTVDAPNPTPPTRWVLVNFVEAQVPVLLVFQRPVSAILSGRAGNWTLSTIETYAGDVYVRLPLGTVKLKSQVADLGAAVHLIREQEAVWTGAPPHLKATKFSPVQGGVRVTWVYDRPYALVPDFLALADPTSGITVNDEVVLPDADLEDAPQVFVNNTELSAFFPARPLLNSVPLVVSESPVRIVPVKSVAGPPIPIGEYATGLLDGPTFESRIARTAELGATAAVRKNADDLGAGVLLHAALAAQQRLVAYRSERGFNTPAVSVADPTKVYREAAFGSDPTSPVATAQGSPVRLNGEGQFTCVAGPSGYLVTWVPVAPGGALQIAAPWPFDLNEAKGVAKLEPKPGKDWFTVTLTPQSSEAQVTLALPKGKELPKKT